MTPEEITAYRDSKYTMDRPALMSLVDELLDLAAESSSFYREAELCALEGEWPGVRGARDEMHGYHDGQRDAITAIATHLGLFDEFKQRIAAKSGDSR